MNLAQYLGCELKSDEVIELLEHFEMEVIYDFDRLHENTADSYNSLARAAGFELRFNQDQVLETIWCYVQARDGFTPIAPDLAGVPFYETIDAAQSAAREKGWKAVVAPNGTAWIRLEKDGARHHYEFSSGRLALVTLMRSKE
jgi:hypothetical protein